MSASAKNFYANFFESRDPITLTVSTQLSLISEARELDGWHIAVGMLGFLGVIAPGFLIVYHYHPDLIVKLDVAKLVVFSASLSVPVVFVNLVIATAAYPGEDGPDQKDALIMAAFGSASMLYGALLPAYIWHWQVVRIDLAVPDGTAGSGLTILVGPNGGGKSTILECFRKLNSQQPTFTEGKRNKLSGDRVSIGVDFDSHSGTLRTIDQGGSQTIWESSSNLTPPRSYVLPSRRVFQPYFGLGSWSRDQYRNNLQELTMRGQQMDQFTTRLFNALANYPAFSTVFNRIYGEDLSWTIDQSEQGQYYIKVAKKSAQFHNSDGLGEGVVSLLFIADALFDSAPGETIVIDEPELSLHPQLQRRLLREIVAITSDRQVLISTHSPEMIDIRSIINGAALARIAEDNEGSKIYQLNASARSALSILQTDFFNPHSLGYDARSCFFAEDRLVITEGQEDVVCFNRALERLNFRPSIPFFGFGAGGASKIPLVTQILKALGFSRIGAVFDGDKIVEAASYRTDFPMFRSWILPTMDVRDKPAPNLKIGVCDSSYDLKPSYFRHVGRLFSRMNNYLHS